MQLMINPQNSPQIILTIINITWLSLMLCLYNIEDYMYVEDYTYVRLNIDKSPQTILIMINIIWLFLMCL